FLVILFTSFSGSLVSRISGAVQSSTLDSIPLSMQRQFPDLTPRHLDHLKTLIAKGANQCARAGDKLPDLLDEYIRATTE
ncbi:terminase small subunit, partial [Escherichia coli]